jgi:hypothetical protein
MFWLAWQLLGVLIVIVGILIAVNILTALWTWWHEWRHGKGIER